MRVAKAVLLLGTLLPLPALADELLTVTGIGTVPIRADTARIAGTAEDRGPTAADAIAAHKATVARLTAALARQNVPADAMVTNNFSVNAQFTGPILPGQPRTITGYTALTQITVTVPLDEHLAEVMQGLMTSGLSQSGRMTFAVRDTTAAMDQARALALKDAIAKAKTLAQQSGVTLGPIRQVTDGANPQILTTQNILQATLANITNAQGQLSVTDTVTVGYAIK
jgi:uncharacterized protein YggE